MRYLVYSDISPNGNIITSRISEKDAVEVQRKAGLFKSYTYKSDEEALRDFMVVHWAAFEEASNGTN